MWKASLWIGRFVALLLATKVAAEPSLLKTIVIEGDQGRGATLSFYTPECPEEVYMECTVADIGCEVLGDFYATAISFDAKELATWLTRFDGTGTLIVDARRFKIRGYNIYYSDLNQTYNISFPDGNHADEIWNAILTAKSMSLKVGARTIELPRTPAMRSAFDQIMKACSKPQ
jgi:hypothetical protein